MKERVLIGIIILLIPLVAASCCGNSVSQGEHDALQQKVDEAKIYGEILETFYFVPRFDFTTSQMMELLVMVEATGDAELATKAQTYLDTGTEEAYYEFYDAVWDGLWEALQ